MSRIFITMENKDYIIIILALLLAGSLLFWFRTDKTRYDEVVVTHTDTIYSERVIVHRDTVPVYFTESIIAYDTIRVCDTICVPIPITQREYSDSLYTAWVSGYNPSLDSIEVYSRVLKETIYNETTITRKEKSRRWNVGIVGGYGYGFQYRGFEPFIGVGVTYNLFP